MPRSPSAPTQTQVSSASDASTTGAPTSVASRNSPKSVKSEPPFSTLSPDQIKIEDEKNGLLNNDNKSIANPSGSSSSGGGGNNNLSAEGQPSSVNAVTPILRQNSTSSLNSPNNMSEHSNSSTLSAALNSSQMVESDLGKGKQEEKKVHVKEEDGEMGSSKAKATSAVAIKEEPNADVLSSLVNMKKEERDNSPNMSPLGFGSIGGNIQDTGAKTVKTEMNTTSGSEKASSSSLAINNNDEMGIESSNCNNQMNPDLNNESLSNTPISSILALGSGVGVGPGPGSGTVPGGVPGNMTANTSSGGSNNCLDYMQQQNHIFVFSTQLANKGAESVLSGQFQTIIAYHCTQPATKNFLEDFFMKNPLKMNKLQQRHTSLGMPWIGMGPGPGSAVPPSKQSQKPAGNLLKNQYNPGDNKRNAFIDHPDPLPSNESDLMCWESGCSAPNARSSNIDVTSESQAIKILEAAGVDLGQSSSSKTGNINDPSHENNIISLQGVKVPDENLTPQQRQHREEQLAKIKKMNQFLFPENENTMGGGTKMPNELIMGIPGAAGGATGAAGGSIINSQMRQLKPEHHIMTTEDVLLPGDVISDMGSVIGCGEKSNLPCGGPGSGSGSGVEAVRGMVNSNELMASFGNDISKDLLSNQEQSLTQPHPHQPGGGAGIAHMEWPKIQQQFFEDRLKSGKGRPVTGGAGGQQLQQPSNPIGQRSLQGPPPPYHSTQRSASVPIATQQSPNPSSPNNLSLPSPRTTIAGSAGATVIGLSTNSPNVEGTTLGSGPTAQTVVTSSGSQQVGVVGGVLSTSKNCFQSDAQESPPNQNPANRSRNNLNSNPSTPLSHLSPKELDTFAQSSSAGDNIKSRRPSPSQGGPPRSPPGNSLIESNMEVRFPSSSSPGVIFNPHPPHSHPHPHMQSNANSALNAAYKVNTPNIQLERQISGGSVQFARRSDNIPLNPNSGGTLRPSPQNKMLSQSFDPISSLAQMSQQLTSCVSSMGGSPSGGASSAGMNMNIPDMNMEHALLAGLDTASSLDALNQTNSCHPINPAMMNSMGQQRLINAKMCGPGPNFNPNSPNGLGSGPMPVPGPGPSPANFQGQGGAPPGARLMGRMPLNFGSNFNPNIQVKASTPNTIQYMPVRPQNVNNNNTNNNNGGGGVGTGGGAGNVRMPPSLEFLHRYANPQMAGGGAAGNGASIDGGPGIMPGMPGMMVGPPGAGSMLMASPTEQQQKMANNPGNNYFQNCNQQLAIIEEDGGGGGLDPGMIIGHQPSMIRGMRPHNSNMLRPHVMGPRLQQPVVNRQLPFTGHGADLDCSSAGDPTAFFNSANGPTAALLTASQQQQQQQQQQSQQQQQQQQQSKSQLLKTIMPAGMCQSQAGGVGQMHQLQGQGLGPGPGPGSNNNNINVPSNGGVVSNVNFVGPSSNDLKYAQQYHSFQQQLYATNTRSQQQQQQQQQIQQQQGNMLTMPPNLSPNPAFFATK
ncbi:protein BCL9 homolog [Drosophila serrata]|uniref:protein BCL9 homolog n=1 Tax=Drosophila serrata TaxID=7274 RepID=UPI000A1D24DC|nr:protein BCL9 homolog [Drosophila serrata]